MSNREVDPNEAPEGYYATEPVWDLPDAMCKGCVFTSLGEGADGSGPVWLQCPNVGCSPPSRKDKRFVIFKKKEA